MIIYMTVNYTFILELQLAALLGKSLLKKNNELEQNLRRLQEFAEETVSSNQVKHLSITLVLCICKTSRGWAFIHDHSRPRYHQQFLNLFIARVCMLMLMLQLGTNPPQAQCFCVDPP